MSEVLSQSQIDALLNAVRSGEKDLEESSEESAEKKYRKYDFNSPRKFTKDRLKMLGSIFENYTRIINSRLNAQLHTNCEVEVESIEEQRYYEFSNALTESEVLALAQVRMKDKVEDTPAMLYLTTSMVLSMLDRTMGGDGDVEDDLSLDYTYTDLELRLYENLVEDLYSVMGVSWESYLPLEFEYTKTDTNPTLSQIIGLDEIVVIVDMKLEFPNASGRMSVCLPGVVLSDIFTEISKENPGHKNQGDDCSRGIFNQLRPSTLEVVATLGDAQMTLADIYQLGVGDVIDLGQPKDSPILLNVGGQQWFTGRMGTYKKNMAVKIQDICYQAEQRSE